MTLSVVIIIRVSSQKRRGSQSEKILASLTHDKVHQPPSVFYIQILKSQFFVNICRIFYPQQQQKLLLFLVKCLRRQLCNYVCCKNYRKYLLSKLLQHLFSVIQILPYIFKKRIAVGKKYHKYLRENLGLMVTRMTRLRQYLERRSTTSPPPPAGHFSFTAATLFL